MDYIETCCAVALLLRLKKKKKGKKQYWVHPIVSQRFFKGQFYKMHSDLRNHPKKFFQYYRMSIRSFDELHHTIGTRITYKNTNWRKSVPPEERLSVTLRFLATGESFNSLHFQYLLGATTIREIVKDTCKVIWECLQPLFMPEKSEKDWMDISSQFYERTNFPNCIGAVDGKHIALKKSINTGSEFYNCKHFFSTVLMGVVDADYCFTAIDVGAYEGNRDSNIFKKTNFYQRLNNNQLNLPNPRKLPFDDVGKPMPFALVGNEAFALSQNILRPYPRKNLSIKQRVFNYRLTRARRMVECSFGILANKWMVFHHPIEVNIDFAEIIIKSCCALHNFVRKKDGVLFEDESYQCPLQSIHSAGTRANYNGLSARDYFADYFVTPKGSLPWQYDKI